MSIASLPLNGRRPFCDDHPTPPGCGQAASISRLPICHFLLHAVEELSSPCPVLLSVSLTVLAQSMLPLRDLQHESKHEELQRLQQATLLQCVSRPVVLVASHQTCCHLCVAQSEMCVCVCVGAKQRPPSLKSLPLLFISDDQRSPSHREACVLWEKCPPLPTQLGVGAGSTKEIPKVPLQ